jgi:hypothetical protein
MGRFLAGVGPRKKFRLVRRWMLAFVFCCLFLGLVVSGWFVLVAFVGYLRFVWSLLGIRCQRCHRRLWSGLVPWLPKRCPDCGEPT